MNKFQRYNSKIASKVTKIVMKLRLQLKETDFDGMYPISILAFLKELCDACDSIRIYEGVATWFFFVFYEADLIFIGSSVITMDDPRSRTAR